jgi:rRNA maturation endonuclease Nob1
MSETGFMPNGREWECAYCQRRYPENYEPNRCEACGGPLSRVLAVLRLRQKGLR